MEKLRSTGNNPQEIETTGTATYPDIIKVASSRNGRAIDEHIQELKIKKSYNFFNLKNLGRELREELVAKFHINGAELNDSPTNIFRPDETNTQIRIPAEERNFDQDGILIPKDRSIGSIVHFSFADSFPSPKNLTHLLLEDANYDAATAAFFLTNKDRLHALFRTSNSPQLKKNEVQEEIKSLVKEKDELINNYDKSKKEATLIVLKKAILTHRLKHFSGQLNTLTLFEELPNSDYEPYR